MGGLSLSLDMGLGNSSSAFSPASISTIAWYDPSDLTTLFKDAAGTTPVTADGDIVLRINDKSGNGYHMTVAANGPTYKTGGFLRFDGVNDQLVSASIAPTGIMIRSTCLKQIVWGSNAIWDSRAGGGVQTALLWQSPSTPSLNMYNGPAGGSGASTAGAAVGTAAVVRERWSAGGSGITVNNGSETTSAMIAAANQNGWTLGSGQGSSAFGNFDFYGMVMIAGSTPSTSVDTYLGAKAGLSI